VAERGSALRSVAHHDAKLRLYRHGDVEVTVVEIGPGSALAEASLWESPTWHLVVEGHATFQQGERSWDILPDESLQLDAGCPFTIFNPSAQRLKLLSVTLGSVRTEPGSPA
jgi:mannose-6-phosphate isomerase-like protein (cupin superfamily)